MKATVSIFVRSGPTPIGTSEGRKHVCFGSTRRLPSDLLRGHALFLSLELHSRTLTGEANDKYKLGQHYFARNLLKMTMDLGVDQIVPGVIGIHLHRGHL